METGRTSTGNQLRPNQFERAERAHNSSAVSCIGLFDSRRVRSIADEQEPAPTPASLRWLRLPDRALDLG